MIKKSISKLVGLKKVEFDLLVQSGQIILQPARLIPTHKTGDEMALTSVFLYFYHFIYSRFTVLKLNNY